MTTQLTIKSPADVPLAVAAFLGFVPENSLVVVAMGGGPTARVDLGPESVEALVPAVPHWSNVLFVVYSDDQADVERYRTEFTTLYPQVTVLIDVHVAPDGAVNGVHQASTLEVPDSIRVVSSRAALVAEADEMQDADEALAKAYEHFYAGAGAAAWVYLDRARTLGLNTSDCNRLDAYLRGAVQPDTVKPAV